MGRLIIFLVALAFTAGLALLTALDIARYGLTVVSLIALIIVIMFGVGILGALRQPPRR